jgi:hypothetical protein
MPVVRWEVEKELDALLSRAGPCDPVPSHHLVRDVLAQNPGRDVCIVVVTTSLEEVGRDHDFDWAITEPLSTRGIIQLSGRVRRHRRGPVDLTHPNVLILDKPIRLIEESWPGGKRDVPPLSFPGIETPFAANFVLARHRSDRLGCYDTKAMLDMAAFQTSITASEIVSPKPPRSPLCVFERKRLAAMFDGLGYPALSIAGYASGRRSLWIRQTYADRRFRRSVDDIAIYPEIEVNASGKRIWRDHDGQNRSGDDSGVKEVRELDTNSLLIRMDWEILAQRYETLCSLLQLDPKREETLKSLLSVTVSRDRSGTLPPLKVHPAVGVFPAPPAD